MLTQETKRHIDAARQVLVGVVPNPTSQIDQITNALIYKFMDDMDQSAIKAGGDPSFFVGDLERYAWTRLMDSRLGNQERMNLYSEALLKFSEAKQLPELFRGIFKSAFLPYRSPEVLGLFLKEIDYFDYSHSEELGTAYEYLLSIMGSQGDAGQFRTPRHIIDFIVAAVNPTKDDKVLDPACGTAGFLVSAYKHILEQHDGKNPDGSKNEEKPLTPDQRRALINNFEGYDVDPGMVRISQVNMYLHHFSNPKIYNYNTLSQEERWTDKFDVILANPPFMSPKGGVSTHNKFSVQSSRSEVLFVDYIMNHLRPKGRAGIIIPEGIIFQSGKAHTQLRKNMIADGLYAVASLPQGIFNPYAGVKTSILFFDGELARRSKNILFVKIQHDGTDLGTRKKATEKNDLHEAIKAINNFRKSILENSEFQKTLIAHTALKSVIIENGDFHLSGERYKIKGIVELGNIPLIELGEMLERKSLRAGDSYSQYEVYTISSMRGGFVPQKEYYSKDIASDDRSNYKVVQNTWFGYRPPGLDIGTIGLNTTGKDLIVSPLYEIFTLKEGINLLSGYLFLLFRSEKFKDIVKPLMQGGARPLVNWNTFCQIKIPLPPLELQQQIVAELDGYQNIISGARQVVENWTPKIDIDPEWEKVPIGSVAKVQGGFAFRSQDMTAKDGAQIIKIGNVKDQKFDFSNNPSFIDIGLFNDYKDYSLSVGDILISMTGTAGKRDYGNVCMVNIEGKFLLNQRVGRIVPNSKVINNYLFFALNQNETKDNFYSNATGGVRQGNISNKQIESIKIFLPPLEIQKQIVEKIEAERALVESAKKLIWIYKQKTKDVLSKLWRE